MCRVIGPPLMACACQSGLRGSPPGGIVESRLKLKSVAMAAVAALGLMISLPGTGHAGVNVEINVGTPAPPPPVAVFEYDSYCVGYRQNLYDADWRFAMPRLTSGHLRRHWTKLAAGKGILPLRLKIMRRWSRNMRSAWPRVMRRSPPPALR